MRAAEFIVENETVDYSGLTMVIDINDRTDNLSLTANASGKVVGTVLFQKRDHRLYPLDLEVNERFRGQGIAQTMYDFLKSKGYTITRSHSQTDAGAGFWDKHRGEERVWENVPQPGPSSGAPRQFGPDAKIVTRPMTVKQIISSVPDVPYYNNVVDDWDAKDYSWGVTKKAIEYATYLKDHPESLAKLPPVIVLNGKFEDGAHRVSAIWLLQQRMDPKNPLWSNAKLNVQFVQQGVAEDISRRGFLQGVGAAAALGAGGAAQAKIAPAAKPVATSPSAELLLKWAKKFITDPAELAAFMAQCAHESDNFRAMEEYGSPERFARKYDIQYNPAKAKQLGNTQPGDGVKYRGRGYIQLTGKYNYQKASEWISKYLNHPVDFVKNPDLVSTPTAAALSSLWYWKTFVKPRTASFANTKQVTKNINPGLKGQQNREQKARDWQAALNVKPIKPGKPVKVASR